MKRLACSQLMFICLFALTSARLNANIAQAQEYSAVEEQFFIAQTFVDGVIAKDAQAGGAVIQQHHTGSSHNDNAGSRGDGGGGSSGAEGSLPKKRESSIDTASQSLHGQQQLHYDHKLYYQQQQHTQQYHQQQQQPYYHQPPQIKTTPQHQQTSQEQWPQQQTPPLHDSQHQHHHHQQQKQQQQHLHYHHQLQQPYPQQTIQNHNQHDEHQHSSLAENMQQVMLDGPKRQYHFAHTQVGWRHESTHEGQLSEIIVQQQSYELSHQAIAQDQLTYFSHHQLYHHQHKQLQQEHQEDDMDLNNLHHHEQLMFSGHVNEDHHQESAQQLYIVGSLSSCNSIDNPSMLIMQDSLVEPTCRATSSPKVPTHFSQFTDKPSRNSNVESFTLGQPHQYAYESSLMAAIRHYWREVTGLCLASAVFLNWLFVVVKRRLISSGLTLSENAIESIERSTISSSTTTANSKFVSRDNNSGSAHDSAFEENASPVSLDDNDTSLSSSIDKDKSAISLKATVNAPAVMRQRSSTLKAEPIPIPTSPRAHNSQSASLSNSLSNTSEYNSRYSSDFDSIQRLGRGGFGIVFEARNKIDDCHYAVKRICLPMEKEARERVMREVRALAKLDHAGIVRYYNAWLETPPDEWLKQHDAQLGIVHSKDGTSFPSTDGIYDKNESEDVTRGVSRMGDSGDNSLDVFGNSPFKRRANGYRKFLNNNSSSPSLDIVFEGSGSIRLESENNTEKTNSSNHSGAKRKGEHDYKQKKNKNGDNNDSDSEDSDFIQFESKNNENGTDGGIDGDYDTISSQLTEPFSSSSDSELENSDLNEVNKKQQILREARKKALNYQKELRQLNNVSLAENLHVEKVYLYIQMQLCRKDTLKDWLKTNCENRDKTTIFDLFYQIVDAVEYVHSQDLIHRDLKPSNIFFSLDGTLKIGDFGLCRAKTNTGVGSSLDLQEYVAESDVERGFEAVHTEQVGTQLYMSPEQLNGLSYNQKVDIFAMGLILLELLIPFKTQMQRVNVLFKARNNLYSDEFRADHSQEHELVKCLLNRIPQKRPTATEIKQHELLASAQLSQPVIERIYHRRRTISSNSSTE